MIAAVWSFVASPWTILFATATYALYRWSTSTFRIFERKGLVFIKPLPFVGNFGGILLGKQSLLDFVLESYNAYGDSRVVGIFQFRSPMLLIRDPALIKRIAVKDFDHFVNHNDNLFTEDVEPLMGKSLIMLRDQKWRDMRATLSPAFTGSKMRKMFRLIVECKQGAGDRLLYEARRTQSELGEPYVPELKDVFSRCMTDVIASTAFGVQVNSLAERDNSFYRNGRASTQMTGLTMLRGMFMKQYPRVARFLGLTFFAPELREFYRQLVVDTMQHRSVHGIVRPDMIQLLMDAKAGQLMAATDGSTDDDDRMGFATVHESSGTSTGGRPKRIWTDDDFTAQSFLFFLAGFESSATLLCVTVHELMENRDIQERLIAEVDAVRSELAAATVDGVAALLTYDRLQRMEYLDMVVSESLRKWPPSAATDRQCTRRLTIDGDEGTGDPPLVIEVGESVFIPIFGLHRDPKYFADPERFDPERFSAQNRDTIDPRTYIPFGAGPRNCVASRFALMQVKAYLFEMLSVFTFEVAANSCIPLRLHQQTFSITAVGGYNVHLKPRELRSSVQLFDE